MKITSILFLLIIHAANAQNNISEIYDQGLLNGQFESRYSNGNLKAKGTYFNNVKTGSWEVWDSTGNKIMTREYNPDHGVTVVTFDNNIEKANDAFQRKSMTRNQDGYFPFSEVTPNDVSYSKRLWRVINKTEFNTPLFEGNRLVNDLIERIESSQIKGYSSKSDEFENLLQPTDVSFYKGKTLVGYKVKEDWFFDKSRNTGETRIVGICPIVEVDGKEIDAFWVYYPEVRKHIADLKLDDTFYFHQFNSSIVQESNVEGKSIAEYTKQEEISKEILRVESQTLETEINLWIRCATGS